MGGRRRRWAALSFSAAAAFSLSCSEDFDTRRRAPPLGTLGDEIYTAVCDRLGASLFTEDLEGASYRGVCHRDANGAYADEVDESKLFPVAGTAALARRLGVAKMHALVRRRGDLIAALNATFPDREITDPWTDESIENLDALSIFLKDIVPLYEGNPVEEDGKEDTFPAVTRSVGRLFAALGGPGDDEAYLTDDINPQLAAEARQSLAGLSGRQGYRPLRVALGAIRPALAYPELRQLAQTMIPHIAPGGDMHDALQDLLGMTQWELDASFPQPATALTVDPTTFQPSRPRSKLEIAQAIMLSQNPEFNRNAAPPRFLVTRDLRGYALPSASGAVLFGDSDFDGFADVDDRGRFLGPDGQVAAVDPPFLVPVYPRVTAPDEFGRALGPDGLPAYQYVDTSQSFVASVMTDVEPLTNPNVGEPGAETVVNLLAGAQVLWGNVIERVPTDDPIQAQYPDEVRYNWAFGDTYQSYDAGASPLVGLIHAAGQLLAHPGSDSWLELTNRLVTEHESEVARLVGIALEIDRIADEHDFTLDPASTFWDELAPVLVKILKDRRLFRDLMASLSNPNLQANLSFAFGNFNKWSDRLTYDPNDLNSPQHANLTTGDYSDPSTPVNKSLPDTGDNMSQWHRFLQIIHDMNGVNACNKVDAKVKVKLLGLDLTWPLIGAGYDECELLRIPDIGLLYLDAVIDHYAPREGDAAEGLMEIEDGLLNGILNLAGGIISIDQVFEETSHIQGMSLNPTPQAFNRLVFFGTSSDKFGPFFGGTMPDQDPNIGGGMGQDTNEFITGLIEPLSTSVCPTRTVNYPGGSIELADCALSNANDLLRLRGQGVIFTWEKFGFYEGITPMLQVFDDPEEKGDLLLELLEVLYRHWSTPEHGPECNSMGTWVKGDPNYNPKFCAESGLSRYEPILERTFLETGLLPALADLNQTLTSLQINDPRRGQSMDGLDMLREVALAFFDPEYAQSVGMSTRSGQTTTTYADGVTPTPVTPYELFAHALRDIDVVFEGNTDRHPGWLDARSNLVDTFLTVDTTGPTPRFANRSLPAAVPVLTQVIREQTNANCPDREQGVPCAWGSTQLAQNAAATIQEPMFGTVMNLIDRMSSNPETRFTLQKFLRYLIQQASQNDALHSTLTSLSDMMQLLRNEESMYPLFRAIALVSSPEGTSSDGTPAEGAVDRVLKLTQALTEEPVQDGSATPNPYDRYRMLDRILVNLVTPLDEADPNSATPIEIFMDTIAEVNRQDADATQSTPLSATDFELAFGAVRDFMLSENRGMEQFYKIIRERKVK